ncbi:CDP-glycerol glycerophosphotransferase family protein [Streptomyces catenulae]|uniref:CDP-glycerol glycerophosphotransferase family protein n=1 Tax=Streptomyces catenulae TaxID=66875 RepID=A0ABV2Z3J0_9ACTN|nr:CDP-glycerol glycerophosphotransferase family protein [Streptomyces catenulae]
MLDTSHGLIPPLRVPVGADPERWRTFPTERTVVVIARTVTSTVRVLDVLGPVFRDESRVDLVFAFDPSSAFNDGVHDLIRSVGARVLPWHQYRDLSPDLVITATENADLAVEGHTAPVLVLPHGVGFHKVVPDSRSDQDRLAGVVPDALLRSGRAWLAVSHPDQAAQLAAAHPLTKGRTLLIGDPCHDTLVNAMDLRAAYREALGVTGDRHLIVLSSTWRDRSLLGRNPTLPARLLAELPMDDYAVALVTHPNIVSAHGVYQLRSLLASPLSAGLLRIPPTDGWQATLVAGDLLIGDHGSVTFYGAALGKPLLLGAFSEEEAVPGTPMAELGSQVPRLVPGAPLRPQIERALTDHALGSPGSASLGRLGAKALIAPGDALRRLRTAVYDLLRLELPERPAPLPRFAPEDPRPADPLPDITAVHITTEVHDTPDGPRVVLSRTPAAVGHFADVGDPETAPGIAPGDEAGSPAAGRSPAATFRHLSCSDLERDRELTENASVLVRDAVAGSVAVADRWMADTLSRYPGCLLASAAVGDSGCRVGLRDGRTVTATLPDDRPGAMVAAALVYALLRSGRPLEAADFTLGDLAGDVDLRVVQRDGAASPAPAAQPDAYRTAPPVAGELFADRS